MLTICKVLAGALGDRDEQVVSHVPEELMVLLVKQTKYITTANGHKKSQQCHVK